MIALAGMIALDEDALICDLAETYQIYNYRGLPIPLLATLAAGLRANSRIKMKLSGTKATTETILLLAILDGINLLAWLQSEDGAKGRNRPKSTMKIWLEPEEEDLIGFDTGEEFEEERRKILRRGENK